VRTVLAPYVGVSLNTYTAIIGTVLAAIALARGAAASWPTASTSPLIGPLMMLGGVAALATSDGRAFGPPGHAGSVGSVLLIAMTGFFLPPSC